MSKIMENRNSMKCPDFSQGMKTTDQQAGVAHPPHNKAAIKELTQLPSFDGVAVNDSYMNLLDTRHSVRSYDLEAGMSQAELAYMLWTAFGIKEIKGKTGEATTRPAPSGGARHAFELYAAVQNVEGLKAGIYRHVPTANVGEKVVSIEYLGEIENHPDTLVEMLAKQGWTKTAPVTLFITCVPYRAEWRYGEMAHRVVLIDLGHIGQNIMLSAVALGMGSCCIAAFNQVKSDDVLRVNGVDEFTVYAVTVGKAKE
ncbi:MAG: SagB/ThcOx family dehydrogenase [Defluviitaleaceae bacterium]|nr:SagB/ThcOx family dehydrogenase [Defluviitaleaceae bacterium]